MLYYQLRLHFEDCWNVEHVQDIFVTARNKEEALDAALEMVKELVNLNCWEFVAVETIDIRDTRN